MRYCRNPQSLSEFTAGRGAGFERGRMSPHPAGSFMAAYACVRSCPSPLESKASPSPVLASNRLRTVSRDWYRRCASEVDSRSCAAGTFLTRQRVAHPLDRPQSRPAPDHIFRFAERRETLEGGHRGRQPRLIRVSDVDLSSLAHSSDRTCFAPDLPGRRSAEIRRSGCRPVLADGDGGQSIT